MVRFLLFVVLLCLAGGVLGDENCTLIQRYSAADYQKQIAEILRALPLHLSTTQRIEKISSHFLGKPYLRGALGEGSHALYDKSPLYRTDAFDCLTYVSTVLALIHAENVAKFVQIMKRVQYRSGCVSYFNRLHFTEKDWNSANEKNHYIKDMTHFVCDDVQVASSYINPIQWYRNLPITSIKEFDPPTKLDQKLLLAKLRAQASRAHPGWCHLCYIPLTVLFYEDHGVLKENSFIFDRIPSGSIIEIVNKSIDFKRRIGTDLSIVHLGFAIRTHEGLMFRHASAVNLIVQDVPLAKYLKHYYSLWSHPEQVGIHIEKVMDS